MLIIAHRGASHDAPENTAAAIQLAWQQQADAIEIDIHLSKDGEIIVMHDATTQRTTGFDGKIADLTVNELRELDAGAWKDNSFRGQRVLCLDEVLALLPPRKELIIELKSKEEAIIESLRACLERSAVLPEQIFLVSFDYELMKKAKAAMPHMRVLWVRGASGIVPLEEAIALCKEANLDGLNLSFRWPIDESFMRQMKDAGLKLLVWIVNEDDVARRLAAVGVDYLMTDRPGWIREKLQGE